MSSHSSTPTRKRESESSRIEVIVVACARRCCRDTWPSLSLSVWEAAARPRAPQVPPRPRAAPIQSGSGWPVDELPSPASSRSTSPAAEHAAVACASSRSSPTPTPSPEFSTAPALHQCPLPANSCCSPDHAPHRRRAHPPALPPSSWPFSGSWPCPSSCSRFPSCPGLCQNLPAAGSPQLTRPLRTHPRPRIPTLNLLSAT